MSNSVKAELAKGITVFGTTAIVVALIVTLGSCTMHKPIPITIPVEVKVLVPVADCDQLQVLSEAIKICTPPIREDSGDVKGLCQAAIDAEKMRACLADFGITIDQEVLDCRASVDKLKTNDSR
jgi:hypothetical protein